MHLGLTTVSFLRLTTVIIVSINSIVGIGQALLSFIILFLTRAQVLEQTLKLLQKPIKQFRTKINFKWRVICYHQLIICSNIDQFFKLVEFAFMCGCIWVIVFFKFIVLRLHSQVSFLFWVFFTTGDLLNIFSVKMRIPKYACICGFAEQLLRKLKFQWRFAGSPYI